MPRDDPECAAGVAGTRPPSSFDSALPLKESRLASPTPLGFSSLRQRSNQTDMDKKELNRRAVLAAFADEAGRLPQGVGPETVDVVGNSDDCLRLLIATGISFSRPTDDQIVADGGMGNEPLVEKIVNGDVSAAARTAAAKVASSWLDESQV
ncbi:hypothetical protein BYI23_E001030 (plasmid) [Burkholderia sp. YI23]|nr:hypothetical protein BYI23_E001030 [Burkholderia sp. YI23]